MNCHQMTVMSRISISLLFLAILLCCHGWAAVKQDVRFAQAGMTNSAAGEPDEMTSSAAQGSNGSGQPHDSASGQTDIDDFPLLLGDSMPSQRPHRRLSAMTSTGS